MSIPQNLKVIRSRLKLTQQAFAGFFGLARSTLNSYETGQALPSTEFLIKLSYLIGISVERICYENLREEDLPDSIDPNQLFNPNNIPKNLYDLRDLVKEVKRLGEEIEQLKKKG